MDRAVGALVGLACGDAVGTTVEFRRPGSFRPLDDMVGGGPFDLLPGEWTDDTSMALCLAESLLDAGGVDPADQLRRYLLWRDDGHLSSNGRCFDIGTTTAAALRRFQTTGEPFDPQPDPEAAANGSLMRLAGVPIRFHTDPELAAERSGESSRTTHAAQRPVDACRLTGRMIAELIEGRPADEILDPGFWPDDDLHPEVMAVARGSWRHKEPPAIRGTGYCVDALEAALWAFGGAADFRDSVLRAANLGDDADTTAAIAGQLAGARWGAEGIPYEWRTRLAHAPRIESLALGLYHAGTSGGPSCWPHDDHLHAWWVEPSRVLAGEYPGHPDPKRARSRVDLLVDAGVRTFVDLTTAQDGLDPYRDVLHDCAEVRGLDLRYHNVGIPDLGVTDLATYESLVELIRTEADRGAVYVHCWGGVGRTGTVIGCLIAEHHTDHTAVLDHLARLRAGTRKADRPCPETNAQAAVLLDWLSRST